MGREATDAETEAGRRALAEAERAGFRLMLIGRSALLGLMTLWGFVYWAASGNPTAPAATALSLAAGLGALAAVGTPAERRWHRYAVVAFDAAWAAALAGWTPLLAAGGVPQLMVFRSGGVHLLWLLPAVTALALSPRLTAFAGLAAAAAVWVVFLKATAETPRPLNWSDLPADADAAAYMALVLDPAFAGRGERVQETLALVAGSLVLAAAVARARRVTLDRAAEAFRRRRLERAFGRHVPEAVAARLAAEPDGFPPTLHEATVLHLDAEGFTAFAAGSPPAAVLAALDALLGLAGEEVARRGGVVTGFAGDSLLAVFGAPLADPAHPAQALAAARAILARAGETPLAVRIGIATGPLAAGLVGGAARQAYTVYGETVNRAQRLEAANKRDGGRLLVSAETAARLGPGAGLVPAEPVAAAGFAEPIAAWRPA